MKWLNKLEKRKNWPPLLLLLVTLKGAFVVAYQLNAVHGVPKDTCILFLLLSIIVVINKEKVAKDTDSQWKTLLSAKFFSLGFFYLIPAASYLYEYQYHQSMLILIVSTGVWILLILYCQWMKAVERPNHW